MQKCGEKQTKPRFRPSESMSTGRESAYFGALNSSTTALATAGMISRSLA
jgi:hypothetical protein